MIDVDVVDDLRDTVQECRVRVLSFSLENYGHAVKSSGGSPTYPADFLRGPCTIHQPLNVLAANHGVGLETAKPIHAVLI